MKTCDICGYTTENGKVMSNHKRWKHSGVSFSQEGLKKLQSPRKERERREVFCTKCGKAFFVVEVKSSAPKTLYFCSVACSHSREFSEEAKDKKRRAVKKTLQKKGFSTHEKVSRYCEVCGKEFISSSNRTCSSPCATVLRKRVKRSKVDLTKKENYRLACSFTFALNSFPEEFDFSLVEKNGWYKASNRGGDGSGVSRDHRISVDYGWRNNIDPSIISHPANCELLVHSDNFKKGTNCSISLEELQLKIIEWDIKYGVVA